MFSESSGIIKQSRTKEGLPSLESEVLNPVSKHTSILPWKKSSNSDGVDHEEICNNFKQEAKPEMIGTHVSGSLQV